MFDVDDLKIYRGSDIRITDKIVVTQPTIDQIIEFGEKRYFQTVHTLTGVGADFKWQLWDYLEIYSKTASKNGSRVLLTKNYLMPMTKKDSNG